jgi:phosphopantothenoylcysteine decarboxylase/phosphopantothenate--cysteine ligase
MLDGVNVALCVSGSIAAVKTTELAHELRRRGASVRGVMTEAAQGIIHPWSVEFATENPVVTEITGKIEHVELCGRDGWADVLLLAPATANTVGKIAAAIDDTPVTTCATTALGSGIPVLVAPAMHEPMYDHPGVTDAIARVESWGVSFVPPRIEEGKAKIASEDAICLATARAAGDRSLEGKEVVVTSGATAERIDPVRTLTNRASGRTGWAVARACYVLGARVTLVEGGLGNSGSRTNPDRPYATTDRVESAAEMLAATEVRVEDADALISVAAISDYTTDPETEKIRSGGELTLDLEPTPKLLDEIRREYPDLAMVGFKAETSGDDDAMVEKARDLLERVGLTFVVANDAHVMGDLDTRALFVRSDDVSHFAGSKADLGLRVADELVADL